MTYDKDLCGRLCREARADDERTVEGRFGDALLLVVSGGGNELRVRERIRAMADQLEAAGAEIADLEGTVLDHEGSIAALEEIYTTQSSMTRVGFDRAEAAERERDKLQAELEAARREVESMRPVVEAAEHWRDNVATNSGDYLGTSEDLVDERAIIESVDAYRSARKAGERCDECDPSFTACFNDPTKCVKRPTDRDEESDYEKRNRELHRLGRLAGKP